MLHFTFCCVQFVVLRVGKPINKASARLNRRLLLLWLRLPPEAADTAGSCHFLSPAADRVPSPSERRKQSGSLSQLVSVAPIRLRTALRRCESHGEGPGRLGFFCFFVCLMKRKKERRWNEGRMRGRKERRRNERLFASGVHRFTSPGKKVFLVFFSFF